MYGKEAQEVLAEYLNEDQSENMPEDEILSGVSMLPNGNKKLSDKLSLGLLPLQEETKEQ